MATILRGNISAELKAYAIEIGAVFVTYPRCSGCELNNSDHMFRMAMIDRFPEAIIKRGSPEYPGEIHLS